MLAARKTVRNRLSFFVKRVGHTDEVADARLFQRVAVQFGNAARDDLAALVVPGAVADAIARVDGVGALRAEIGMPRHIATPDRSRERLTMGIGAGESSQVRAAAKSDAGHEE